MELQQLYPGEGGFPVGLCWLVGEVLKLFWFFNGVWGLLAGR
jgi:hypothetical protein